ncbi:hypothetical protein CCHR01_16827 [Colletotrichum chrysophilum]|uniref:Uncharacterized protein n=1 Tax=Colletotrichum chrysophilum TaxID=1836956 RepID=A0AAD9A3J3_9PEZI|nr:hypothetical protein CCHR01_16827 [Colletotrichum chrysophilum]
MTLWTLPETSECAICGSILCALYRTTQTTGTGRRPGWPRFTPSLTLPLLRRLRLTVLMV